MKKGRKASTLKPLWETQSQAGSKLQARAELLQAAAQAFMKGGYSNTTLNDVADQAGATKGQIYHYYRSKMDLYFDVVIGAIFMLNSEIFPIAERVDIAVEERLRKVAFEHVMGMTRMLPFQKVALEATQNRFSPTSSRERRAVKRMLQLRGQYEKLIANMIVEGTRTGVFEVSSVASATKAVLGALNWPIVWYDSDRSPPEAHKIKIASQAADFIIEGLKPSGFSTAAFANAARAASPSFNGYFE